MAEAAEGLLQSQKTRCESVLRLRRQQAGEQSAVEEWLQADQTEAWAARPVQVSELQQRASRAHHPDRRDEEVCRW